MAISKEDVDKIVTPKVKGPIAPFIVGEGDTITASALVNKLNEIIECLNSLDEVKVAGKNW